MVIRPLPILAILILLAGCQSPLMLMPTPEVLKDERFNAFEANPDPLTSNEIGTLYATTRVRKDDDGFQGRPDDQLHLGYAILRIGNERDSLLEIIRQSTTEARQTEYAWELLSAPVVGSTPRLSDAGADASRIALSGEMAEAMRALNDYINENPIKELTIYVHGANNTFYWSVSQGAQFQYFTGDNAMVLTFAWPSVGNMWGYEIDKRRADAAAADLAYLIELLAAHSVASRINLLAYSSGGRVVGRALDQLAATHPNGDELRLGQVYLTQSDQPLAEFAYALPRIFPLLEGLTVTAAKGDPVLRLASATDLKLRLGATGEGDGIGLKLSEEKWQQIVEIMNSDDMVFIDLVEIPVSQYRFSHGAWYENSWVSTDVMVTLLGGLSAVERGLQPVRRNDVRIWTFPDDYLDRVKATIISRRDPDRGQPPPDP